MAVLKKAQVNSSLKQTSKCTIRVMFVCFLACIFVFSIRSGRIPGNRKHLLEYSQLEDFWKLNTADESQKQLPKEVIDVIVASKNDTGPLNLDLVGKRDFYLSWSREEHREKVGQEFSDSENDKIFGRNEEEQSFAHRRELSSDESLVEQIQAKVLRRTLRQQRKEKRVKELIVNDEEALKASEDAAIMNSKVLDTARRSKYSIWRRDSVSVNPDSTIKLIQDQIIMAKVYASIARTKDRLDIYSELMRHVKDSQRMLGEATVDSQLPKSASGKMNAMSRILNTARQLFYDGPAINRKLRAMAQSSGEHVKSLKKQTTFLSQLAAKTIPKGIHCLSLLLTIEYYFLPSEQREFPNQEKLEDPSLFHYALFSDNVLAVSVVINSTVLNAKEPEKHVFHLVTDKLNYAAMKMWFLKNPPGNATIHVENIEDFKWLNSSYCPVLKQLESTAMREYYFKSDRPATLEAGVSNLKYRNPKYLSMLNHLRFYLPQIYPKLDKILFLDDDIVVQRDLTPLWSVNLQGKVNGAVETCGESFHRFDTYLNFSNPLISQNFDSNACGWAYGMNIFDLKEWKRRDITGIYHKWQSLNEYRTLWKLGTLPPGLITFYNLTYPLNSTWHVLGLGYNAEVELSEIENAGVAHYNGNMKPWLELAIVKYRSYWSRYVDFSHPYIQQCNFS